MHTNTILLITFGLFIIPWLILTYIASQRAKKLNASLSKEEILQCVAFNQSIPSYARIVKILLILAPYLIALITILITFKHISLTILISTLVTAIAVEIVIIVCLHKHQYKQLLAFDIKKPIAKRLSKHSITTSFMSFFVSIIIFFGTLVLRLYCQ